ncbi:MAG: hydroxymethylbilane synthase [Treponema sp.]|jgi:hydroxymethylbilane synthase|nr:hydroxymethylbilane synthase [Treponema sp.]
MNIRVGSRESALALAQTELVIRMIKEAGTAGDFEICSMKTSGDLTLDRPLGEVGGKGLFTKELDRALLAGTIDFAVHSLKDIPWGIEKGLKIAAFSNREDPRDVLILPQGSGKSDRTKAIGCSSLRRQLQLKKIFPDWETRMIRGNVLTRLEKLERGEYGALVLAAAGVKRLGLENRISRVFETPELMPAAGQGIMAVITRETDCFDFLDKVSDTESHLCALAERAFVGAMGGDCGMPIASFAEIDASGTLTLHGLFFEGHRELRGMVRGDKNNAKALGVELARKIQE